MSYLKHQQLIIEIGKKVKELRELKGLSQYELSYQTNISRNQIGRIERGEINTSISQLKEIADGLGVEMKELLP